MNEKIKVVKINCKFCLQPLEKDFDKINQAHFNCFEAMHNYNPETPLKDQILLILDNIDKIDSKYWQDLEHYPDKKVIWFLNRQRPNVEADYSFDEERIGITNQREIVWGFDSGCSCPSPWNDNSDCYNIVKEWHEFIMNKVPFNSFSNEDFNCNWFDEGWEEETMQNLALILKEINVI